MNNENKARNEIENILRTSEYQVYYDQSKGVLVRLWERIQGWILEQLSMLFPNLTPSGSLANATILFFIVVFILVMSFVIVKFARQFRKKQKFQDQVPFQTLNSMNWSSKDHFEEAEKQQKLEAYPLALRHSFLGLLLYFQERKWLEARVWKTNGEYYDELLQVNSTWANQFYHLARNFDEVTYGERVVQKQEYMEFQDTVKAFIHVEGIKITDSKEM